MQKIRAIIVFLTLFAVGHSAADPADFKAGVDLFKQRNFSEAQQAFEALDRATPNDPEVLFYLGRVALQRNELEKAVAILEKAAALAPDRSAVQVKLGDAYGTSAQKASLFSQLGLAKKCRSAYEKAVELDNKNVEARQSLMQFYLQAPGITGGSNEKARVQAEAIKQLNPPRGRQALASVYSADKKYDLALAEFDEVLKTSPDDYTSLYQVGRLAANTGQFLDRGLASLRRCATLPVPEGEPGHAPAYWRMGNILEKKGDKAGARAAYENALKVDAKFAQAIESLKKL